jgi:hypothetical protein
MWNISHDCHCIIVVIYICVRRRLVDLHNYGMLFVHVCVCEVLLFIFYCRHLDVSQGEPTTGCNYPHPAQTLYEWVSHMPYLEYLDIANTNLADQHGPSFGNNNNNNVDECPM